MAGHSFGGMTAVSVSRLDARIKLCATLDPWFYCYNSEIMKGNFELNVPQFIVTSEYFHTDKRYSILDFGTWASI